MIGFKINGKHSYRDYGLILENPYQLTPPLPKVHYVSVPGRSGQLDLTEALTGRVEYENRTLTLELGGIKTDWPSFFTIFLQEVHGKKVEIVFDNDTTHYLVGRATVREGFEKVARLGKFRLEITCKPYRLDVTPFTYSGTVTNSLTVAVPKSQMPVVPEITCTIASGNTLTVSNNGTTHTLKNGTQVIQGLELFTDLRLVFRGTGSVTIVARGGCL